MTTHLAMNGRCCVAEASFYGKDIWNLVAHKAGGMTDTMLGYVGGVDFLRQNLVRSQLARHGRRALTKMFGIVIVFIAI
jgi:hypothetical protein